MKKLLFIGLGRIGLPQSLVFAKRGFFVIGYDLDDEIIRSVLERKTPFHEPFMDEYLDETLNDNFFPTSNWADIISQFSLIDGVFFTFGTSGLDGQSCLKENQFDLSAIEIILSNIFEHKNQLKKDIKLIFRTTLPLGSTEILRKFIENKYCVKEGENFHLAFVPERLVEGKAIKEEQSLPKIIGCYNEDAFIQIRNMFSKIGGDIIRVADPTTAEFCKLSENAFRSTLFSYANDLAIHAGAFGIDVQEVINAINYNYPRNFVPQPGFVSGYCLSKDPYIFEYHFKKDRGNRDFNSIWYYGRKINDYLVDFSIQRVLQQIKDVQDPVVTILGLAFKENIDDFRMSHVVAIIEKFVEYGIKHFRVFDPKLGKNKYSRLPSELEKHFEFSSVHLSAELFVDSDVIFIGNRHQELVAANNKQMLKKLLAPAKVGAYIFDSWNIWREAEKIKDVRYEGLGYFKANENTENRFQLNDYRSQNVNANLNS